MAQEEIVQTLFCSVCGRDTKHTKKTERYGFVNTVAIDLVLSLLTCGLWFFLAGPLRAAQGVRAGMKYAKAKSYCAVCGTEHGKEIAP